MLYHIVTVLIHIKVGTRHYSLDYPDMNQALELKLGIDNADIFNTMHFCNRNGSMLVVL